MTNESGCRQTRYGFVFIMAAMALVVWLIIRYTTQGRVSNTNRT